MVRSYNMGFYKFGWECRLGGLRMNKGGLPSEIVSITSNKWKYHGIVSKYLLTLGSICHDERIVVYS